MTYLQPQIGVGDAIDGRLEAAHITAELHVGGGLTGRAEARQALAKTPAPQAVVQTVHMLSDHAGISDMEGADGCQDQTFHPIMDNKGSVPEGLELVQKAEARGQPPPGAHQGTHQPTYTNSTSGTKREYKSTSQQQMSMDLDKINYGS
jgi:hypothetical protein